MKKYHEKSTNNKLLMIKTYLSKTSIFKAFAAVCIFIGKLSVSEPSGLVGDIIEERQCRHSAADREESGFEKFEE